MYTLLFTYITCNINITDISYDLVLFYLFVHENLSENSEEPTSHSMIKKKLFDRKLFVNAYSPVLQKIFDEWLLNLN